MLLHCVKKLRLARFPPPHHHRKQVSCRIGQYYKCWMDAKHQPNSIRMPSCLSGFVRPARMQQSMPSSPYGGLRMHVRCGVHFLGYPCDRLNRSAITRVWRRSLRVQVDGTFHGRPQHLDIIIIVIVVRPTTTMILATVGDAPSIENSAAPCVVRRLALAFVAKSQMNCACPTFCPSTGGKCGVSPIA